MNTPGEESKRLHQAADSYGVIDADLQPYLTMLTGQSRTGRQDYGSGWIHGVVLVTAEDHRADCSEVPCRTCAGLARALTMLLALERAEADAHFNGIVEGFDS